MTRGRAPSLIASCFSTRLTSLQVTWALEKYLVFNVFKLIAHITFLVPVHEIYNAFNAGLRIRVSFTWILIQIQPSKKNRTRIQSSIKKTDPDPTHEKPDPDSETA